MKVGKTTIHGGSNIWRVRIERSGAKKVGKYKPRERHMGGYHGVALLRLTKLGQLDLITLLTGVHSLANSVALKYQKKWGSK